MEAVRIRALEDGIYMNHAGGRIQGVMLLARLTRRASKGRISD